MPSRCSVRYLSRLPRVDDVVFRILTEMFAVSVMVLAVMIMFRKMRASKPKFVFEGVQYEDVGYHTGDLLVICSPSLQPVHKGHLAMVIRAPQTNQLFLWDLQIGSNMCVLQPLYHVLRYKIRHGQEVYCIPLIGKKLDTRNLLRKMRNYTGSKYEFHCLIEHAYTVLHEYCGFPGIPVFGTGYKNIHFYCSEVIFHVLIDIGMLRAEILTIIPDLEDPEGTRRVFYPENLIQENFDINLYTLDGFYYGTPKQVLI
jgi:hypothetical protein